MFEKLLAKIVPNNAMQAALHYAGQSGAMLTYMDIAISYIDAGEYDDARRILQDSINEFGESSRDLLDNYQPPVIVVEPLITDADIVSAYPELPNVSNHQWWYYGEGSDPRD